MKFKIFVLEYDENLLLHFGDVRSKMKYRPEVPMIQGETRGTRDPTPPHPSGVSCPSSLLTLIPRLLTRTGTHSECVGTQSRRTSFR